MSAEREFHALDSGNAFAGNFGSVTDGMPGFQLPQHVLVSLKKNLAVERRSLRSPQNNAFSASLSQTGVNSLAECLNFVAGNLGEQCEHDPRSRVSLSVWQ